MLVGKTRAPARKMIRARREANEKERSKKEPKTHHESNQKKPTKEICFKSE